MIISIRWVTISDLVAGSGEQYMHSSISAIFDFRGQYGSSSFQPDDTKLEIFLLKNQHTQKKFMNLRVGVMAICQKLVIILVKM